MIKKFFTPDYFNTSFTFTSERDTEISSKAFMVTFNDHFLANNIKEKWYNMQNIPGSIISIITSGIGCVVCK